MKRRARPFVPPPPRFSGRDTGDVDSDNQSCRACPGWSSGLGAEGRSSFKKQYWKLHPVVSHKGALAVEQTSHSQSWLVCMCGSVLVFNNFHLPTPHLSSGTHPLVSSSPWCCKTCSTIFRRPRRTSTSRSSLYSESNATSSMFCERVKRRETGCWDLDPRKQITSRSAAILHKLEGGTGWGVHRMGRFEWGQTKQVPQTSKGGTEGSLQWFRCAGWTRPVLRRESTAQD